MSRVTPHWGSANACRFGVADLRCTPPLYPFEYPFSPPEMVEFFRVV